MQENILIVDDNEALRCTLQTYFEREGYTVTTAADGYKAIQEIQKVTDIPTVVILDVELPPSDPNQRAINGIEVCRRIRSMAGRTIGIVMISGIRRDEDDRILGREKGANAYLTRPVSNRELLSQVQTTMETVLAQKLEPIQAEPAQKGREVVDGYLSINWDLNKVKVGGLDGSLTPLQWKLFNYLYIHANRVCTTYELLENVWKDENVEVESSAVSACVFQLRQKIEPVPSNPRYVINIPGTGYYFNKPEE